MINKLKIDDKLSLLKVSCSEEHIKFLYELLKTREKKNSISHLNLPKLENHAKFVANHPYRFWYIVIKSSMYFGATYISETNSISIQLLENDENSWEKILLYLIKKIKPLKKIPSVRNEHYTVNISANNIFCANIIKKLGGKKIQETYLLKHN
ncbi:MAG: hypothetical protein VX089_00275 [Pseudomonadota bacterium]|nr:hypothetical protein [Pseudomonadota bacterium]